MWTRMHWCEGQAGAPDLRADQPPGMYFVRADSGARNKTTARGGKPKSALSRAKAHVGKSAGAGRANASAGASRRVGRRPARARNERGPGDVGPNTRIVT